MVTHPIYIISITHFICVSHTLSITHPICIVSITHLIYIIYTINSTYSQHLL